MQRPVLVLAPFGPQRVTAAEVHSVPWANMDVLCCGGPLEKHVAIFRSFEEAEQAEREYYRSLTPIQRLAILTELNSRWPRKEEDDSAEGLARVCRVVKLA